MKIYKKIHSQVDNTIKYILITDDNLVVEFSYINKDDGKDIICVPTQTACHVGCKFCHITDAIGKLVNRNITGTEIFNGVKLVFDDLNLIDNPKVLLISYMGCGEPTLNVDNVIESMVKISINYQFQNEVPLVRFGIATSIPRKGSAEFFRLTSEINRLKLPVKIHLSLHYTNDTLRAEWMPNSIDIIPSILALEYYKRYTGNSVEIHYALIDGVNDTDEDAQLLTSYLKDRDIPVKFLFYNEKPTLEFHASPKEKLETFATHFNDANIDYEYYIPPGLDVAASCGLFILNEYYKFNHLPHL
jgi:23S rRNA (adenine2503-C2)-methyltransferase